MTWRKDSALNYFTWRPAWDHKLFEKNTNNRSDKQVYCYNNMLYNYIVIAYTE